jgi:pyruvate kinase
MLTRIATEVEPSIQFVNHPPNYADDTHAISEAFHAIDDAIDFQCIVVFAETGYTAKLASEERSKAPIVAYTPDPKIYRQLSLNWGVRPVLLHQVEYDLSTVLPQVEADLMQRQFAVPGDKVLIMGGIPFGKVGSTNFLQIHTIAQH